MAIMNRLSRLIASVAVASTEAVSVAQRLSLIEVIYYVLEQTLSLN
jgi:hypothetical protein